MMLVPSLPPLPVGGSEMQALKLGKALSEQGVIVRFIMPGKNDIKGEDQIFGMAVYRLNSWLNRIFGWISLQSKKKKVKNTRIEYNDKNEVTDQMTSRAGWPTVIYYNIFFYHSLFFLWWRRKQFDIIHSHTMEWSAIVAVRLGKLLNKLVIIKDSTMNGFQSLSRFPSGVKLQKMIAGSAHFVAMTEMIHQNLLKSGITAEKITKIPNGIVVSDSFGMDFGRELPSRVLFVGNLYQQPAKGVDILFHAWKIVHQSFPEVQLEIVGDGDINAYKEFVRGMGISNSIQFWGKQNDLSHFHQSASVFVLPSRREGMSNALMEAMLYGIPCVATDISGSRDLITDKVNGILVPSADSKALAAGISYLLANPEIAMEMGRKGHEKIIEELDIRKIADKYILLYSALLKKFS